MTFINIIFITIILLLTAYCAKLKLRQADSESISPHFGETKLNVSNNDVMQYIREITGAFLPYMESKGIKFSVKCTPEGMMGWIDTDKIGKTLLLLIADMAKDTPSDGRIIVNVNSNSSYDKVFIYMHDKGPKIGNMGYSIAQYFVHLHQGKISSSYYEGQGNSLAIEIPITKNAFQAITSAEGATPAFNIPNNIELHVPSIDLPLPHEAGGNSLEAIFSPQQSADQEYLQRAVRCINEHIMDSDYDRETFAADMGSSVSTLYNKIRSLTGKNITNFVRDIRIRTACRLAKENPDLRVSDIAYQVGFKDPKYFATSFKRVMGVQPKEYFNDLRGVKEEQKDKEV